MDRVDESPLLRGAQGHKRAGSEIEQLRAPDTPRSTATSASVSSRAFVPDKATLMRRAANSLKSKVRVNCDAFARLAALRMDGRYAIEHTDKKDFVVQRFNPVRRIWERGGGYRFLLTDVTDVLYDIFPDLDEEAKCIFGNSRSSRR